MNQEGHTDDPLIGRLIGEKFRIEQCIGVGASGTVYRADQVALGRTVAVKFLRPELAGDERIVKRFHAEALAASRLNHPNTVSVLDYGQTDDGLLYIVMEYLRGETLTAMIQQSHPLADRHIADLMSQVLAGLEEAHAAGVVHADLKADNIVVEHRRGGWDLAKVVDFGIARLAGVPREAGDKTVCGTPEYMAPEIIAGADPTIASDLYAAGVVLYEMLAGATPFGDSGSSLEVLTRHIRDEPRPPHAVSPDVEINPKLAQAAMRALNKRVDQRFASAVDFRAAVAAAVDARAPESTTLCSGCGVEVAQSFKFCPECGQPTNVKPRATLELNPALLRRIPTSRLGTAATMMDQAALAALSPDLDAIEPAPAAPPKAAGIFPLPHVGRERELAELERFLDGQTDARVLSIAASAGAGRSRLVKEACTRAAGRGKAVFLASFDPTGLAASLYPARAIVGAVLDLPPVCTYEALGDAIEAIGLTRRDLPGIAALFGHDTQLAELEAPVRRREMMAASVRVLQAAATKAPTVLAFENADLYDAPSQELLRRLIESAQDSELRVVISSDPDFANLLHGVDKIQLGPLPEDALRAIAEHVARSDNEAMPGVPELLSRTDASPMHIAQLIRYVTEGGQLETAPNALADLIAARLALLPRSAVRVLQAAATAGLECTRAQLVAVLPDIDPGEVDAALDLLAARELLLIDSDFVWWPQSFVREVAYEATPADVRRSLHAASAQHLALHITEPAVLGHHRERAGQHAKAAQLLELGGDAAVAQLDDGGACQLYKRALGCARSLMLADDDPVYRTLFVTISVKLAEALRVSGELALARGIIEEARGHSHGSPSLEAQLLRAAGHLYTTEGDVETAIAMLRDGVGLAIQSGKTELLCELYLELSSLYLRNSEPDRAINELEEGLNLVTLGEGAAAESGPANLWRLLWRLSHLYGSHERRRDSVRVARHALNHARSARSGVGIARSQALLAEQLDGAGDFATAARYRHAAVEQLRKLGDRRATAELLLAGGSPTNSLMRIKASALREARELASEIGWNEGVARAESHGR